MSFVVRKPGAGAVALDDLGITVTGIATTERDLRDHAPADIAASADLAASIAGGTLVVLDPRDDSTALSIANGELARATANDTHYGVNGGRFATLDAPGTVITDNFIVQYNLAGDAYESINPATLITDQTETIEDIIGAMGVNGTDTTFTYNDGAGTLEWSVDDVFLRNTGDTLDSGTLSIAAAASIAVLTGADLTLADLPVNPTDAANKQYVDSVASGLDPKESVRVATTVALTMGIGAGEWVYANNGGVGDTLTNNTASLTTIDTIQLVDGDRVVVKNQVDAKQNGIYTASAVGAGSATILTRATDQDGSPTNEVSAGNFTFVEQGSQANTGWVVTGDGILTLNTDDINWVQFSASAALTAGIGLTQVGNEFRLHIENLVVDTITSADEIAFNDTTEPDVTNKTTVANFLTDLNIVSHSGGNGILVQTAANTYTNRSIAVDGAGALDGLVVANGDGVAGNPTVGLDIQNLPLRAAIDAALDRVAVWDSSVGANVYYTVSDISTALATVNSFETWAAAGNSTGDASVVADSATDTVTMTGGIGININMVALTDTLTFTFSRAGMADTPTVAADTVPFFDASNFNEPEYRSWTNIISDLGLISGLSASANEDLLGIDVTGSVVGFDILGLTNPVEDMAATDEFAVHNKSEGTAGANRKMTGQEIADGTATLLGISALGFSTFVSVNTPTEDQTLLSYVDATRASKVLSVESHTFLWSDTQVDDNDWIDIGKTGDANIGWIMPMNGTVVGASAYTVDANSNTYAIDLYIDAVDSGPVVTLTGVGADSDSDPSLNLNFTAGQRLRLRGDQTAGTSDMDDTTVAIMVKWRVL